MPRSGPRSGSRLGGRVAFAAVAYAFTITMAGTTLPTPLYPLYRERFGLSQLMITVVFATYALGVIAALLLFGRLSDQVGRRRAMLPALAASAASAVVFLLADSLALLLVGRVLSGLSSGIFTGTATAALVDLVPGRRARATGVATAANMGGLGCGPLLSGVVTQYLDDPLRTIFVLDLALLVPAMIGVWLMPETVAIDGARRLRMRRPRVPPGTRGVFVSAALAAFAGFAVLGLYTAVAPAYFAQELGVPNRAVTGLVVFAVFAASTVGQLVLEAARGPGRDGGGEGGRDLGLVVGCAGLVAGMMTLAVGLALTSLAGVIAGGVLAGAGQGLAFRAGLTAVNASAPPHRRAEAASAFFLVAYIAISLPVVGVGVLVELAGLRTAGLVFVVVVALLAGVVLALLARPTLVGRQPVRAGAGPCATRVD